MARTGGQRGCREVPDVSALGGYGYWEVCTSTGLNQPCPAGAGTAGSQFLVPVAGTSLAAPSWAGTIALADAECGTNLGFLNPVLYGDTTAGSPDVGAVTATGNNDFTGTNSGMYPTYSTGAQNLATGLGYLGGVDLSSGVLCQVPSPPTGLTVTPGDGTIQVAWTAPAYQGRSSISGYTATITPGGTTCTTGVPGTPCAVHRLVRREPVSVHRHGNQYQWNRSGGYNGMGHPGPDDTFNGFTLEPGAGTAISEGADGIVWVLGTAVVPGGHPIYKWNGTTWTRQAGGAVTIAVDPTGNPWIINNANKIYHWNGTAWTVEPGAATAISVGADGTPWVTRHLQ